MTFQRVGGHIFQLSGASFYPLETIGWTDGSWFSKFPRTTTGKYHCTSYRNYMKSVWWENMLRNANRHIPQPPALLLRPYIPPSHDMVTQTHEAFLTLAKMDSRHTTNIDKEGPSSSCVVQPSASSDTGPSIGGDIPTSHVPEREPHVWTKCGQSCYGLGPAHGTSTMNGGHVRTLLKL